MRPAAPSHGNRIEGRGESGAASTARTSAGEAPATAATCDVTVPTGGVADGCGAPATPPAGYGAPIRKATTPTGRSAPAADSVRDPT